MREVGPTAYIRILHAVPGAPAVDVYANDNLIARGLVYSGFTPYMRVTPGSYKIQIFLSGTSQNPILSTDFSTPPYSIFTLAAIGAPSNISLLPVQDTVMD